MTKINLLPWREAHRKEKNNEYYVTLAICGLIAAAGVFGGYKFFDDKIAFQDKRNDRLNREIAMLQEQLEEIKTLEETKANLLSRMEIIQELQGQRPVIVHTFQDIATNLPDGVFLTSMKQLDDKHLVLEGRAESNARVSALMRQMDQSEYFKEPKLEVIAADKKLGHSTFKLSLLQVTPQAEEESLDGI